MSEHIFTITLSLDRDGDFRNRGEPLNTRTDEIAQAEELARLEDCALEIDLPGWTVEEWGAKPLSARSFVARRRDHRCDRGKSEPNAMVNDVPETERDAKKACCISQDRHPLCFPSLVSKNKKKKINLSGFSVAGAGASVTYLPSLSLRTPSAPRI